MKKFSQLSMRNIKQVLMDFYATGIITAAKQLFIPYVEALHIPNLRHCTFGRIARKIRATNYVLTSMISSV